MPNLHNSTLVAIEAAGIIVAEVVLIAAAWYGTTPRDARPAQVVATITEVNHE